MIRPIVTLCALLAAAPVTHAASREVAGVWTAAVSEKRTDRLQFSLQTAKHGQNGTSFDRSEFSGLAAAQVGSSARVPVQFELRREAGTIVFEGTFRAGKGAGEFTFVPNRDFPRKLEALGVQFVDKGGEGVERGLFALAIFDVTTDFIRSLQAIGYSVPLEKYEAFRIFDVDPEYVHDMAAVGFAHLSADKLVETRIHGATPDYIREMRRSGDDLPLDKYIESRIFQITPEFASEMARAGYPNLGRDVLVQFKIHGVTTDFINDLKQLGYTRIPAQKLVEMRIHGVTPEYIRRLETAGYKHVPIDKMVQMRIFDIQPEMIRALDDAKGGM